MSETPEPSTEDQAANGAVDTQKDDNPTGNREAAKYRKALREAEAERDQYREQLDGMRRRQIEETAARDHRIAKPESLWAAGADMAAVIGDDGLLNADAVKTWITESSEQLGLAKKPGPGYVAREGSNPGTPNATGDTWQKVIGRRPEVRTD